MDVHHRYLLALERSYSWSHASGVAAVLARSLGSEMLAAPNPCHVHVQVKANQFIIIRKMSKGGKSMQFKVSFILHLHSQLNDCD